MQASKAPEVAAAAELSADRYDRLTVAMRDLARAQRALAEHITHARGCSIAGLGILSLVAGRDGTARDQISLGELAERLRVDLSVASRQVADLVDRGLLERAVDPRDRRVRVLRLTDRGREVRAEATRAFSEVGAALLDSWPAERIDQAAQVLADLAAALDLRDYHPTS